MININELTENDKGRGVVYEPYPGGKLEDGVITSWNDRYIFVSYNYTGRGIATPPEKLEFLYNKVSK